MMRESFVKETNRLRNISLISKTILTLYIAVDLIFDLKAAEYDGVRWFYISVINLISLGYILKESRYFKPSEMLKKVKLYFYLCITFFLVSCLSLINAYNVTEGLVHISRLINILVGVFCVFVLFKNNPKELFNYLAKVIAVLAFYHVFYTLKYFLGNYSKPRTNEFLEAFLHYFGNVNIFTAALAFKLPFAVYLYLTEKRFWKYFGLVVFFLGWLSVFFVGSRTANISLIIVFILLLIRIIYKYVNSKDRVYAYSLFEFLISFLLVFFLGLNSNKVNKFKSNSVSDLFQTQSVASVKNKLKIEKNKRVIEKIQPKNIAKKVRGIDAGRFSLWSSSVDLFKSSPILGIGYGNYKVALKEKHLKNVRSLTGNFKSIRRVHNDFLEKLAETGILGFILYTSLFLFLTVLFFYLYKSNTSDKNILLVSFLSGIIYTLDSLLNFPIERPTAVLYFFLIAGILLAFYQFYFQEEKETKQKDSTSVLLLLVLLLGTSVSAYSNYLVYRSQIIQRTLTFDLKGKNVFGNDNYKYSYQEVSDMWMDYPNLNSSGTNKYYQKALYLLVEKDYKEALRVLDDNKHHTEHQLMVNDLKAKIFYFGLKQLDSGKYYAEKVFEVYPSYYNNYFTLKHAYTKEKDTLNKLRVMNRYTNYNYEDINEWKKKANYIFEITHNMKLATKIIDTAMAYNPNKFSLIDAKQLLLSRQNLKASLNNKELKVKHQLAVNLFKERKFDAAIKVYKDILKISPKDYFAMQNIGIIYLAKRKYYEAIQYLTPVVNAKVFKTGKAEFSRGLAYEKTNQFKKARRDYRASRSKNYHQAMQLKEAQYIEPKDLLLKK